MKDLYYKYRWLPPFVFLILLIVFSQYVLEPQSLGDIGNQNIIVALMLILEKKINPLAHYFFSTMLVALSVLIRIWSRMYIGEHTRSSKIAAPKLITTGPYFTTRNPLYLSNILAGTAIACYQNFVSGILVFFLLLVHYLVVANIEKEFLEKNFLDKYLVWSASTPFLFISPYKLQVELSKPSPAQQPLKAALLADRWTWLWQILAIILVIVL